MTASEPEARTVEATITYVAQGSFINRRFVAPGVEHNTGRYEPHRVAVRDARPFQSQFTLDVQGFVLAERPSAVTDFFDRDQVERLYPNEVVDIVRSLTGATRVATLGWMVRTSGDVARHQRQLWSNRREAKRRQSRSGSAGAELRQSRSGWAGAELRQSRSGSAGAELRQPTGNYTHRGGVQPPAGEAHVDFMPARAESLARAVYEKTFPDGKGFTRFIASSLWRAFSPPPQDCPLAVCDARSVRPDEGIPNTMFVVDQLPDEQTMLGEMPNEASAPAAAIFHYNPLHRWWYFSSMTRDEVLMLKFHDSDRTRAQRTPHTAFQDPTFADARVRESIEVRSIAYFE